MAQLVKIVASALFEREDDPSLSAMKEVDTSDAAAAGGAGVGAIADHRQGHSAKYDAEDPSSPTMSNFCKGSVNYHSVKSHNAYRSTLSRNAWFSVLAANAFVVFIGVNAMFSIGGVNAIGSILSVNSLFSILSLNSVCSIGCVNSVAKICLPWGANDELKK
mmetsp:Transcript_4415/g.9952  ORF Transcript_4415/g.9952 Transcript_4415/m.9952 type:complete len:162 (+) Transcript_4415:28-513(+)